MCHMYPYMYLYMYLYAFSISDIEQICKLLLSPSAVQVTVHGGRILRQLQVCASPSLPPSGGKVAAAVSRKAADG